MNFLIKYRWLLILALGVLFSLYIIYDGATLFVVSLILFLSILIPFIYYNKILLAMLLLTLSVIMGFLLLGNKEIVLIAIISMFLPFLFIGEIFLNRQLKKLKKANFVFMTDLYMMYSFLLLASLALIIFISAFTFNLGGWDGIFLVATFVLSIPIIVVYALIRIFILRKKLIKKINGDSI